ncbi:flagellin [Bacillus sp. C1-1]|nr:flagellin [Bacillus sp. C1-1]
MIINNNMSAMNAHRQLGVNQGMAAKAQEKLSSGLRINRAGDDAAGLAISEKMRAQVRGLDQASRNAQDGISMIQTAEGALTETHSILQRMRELSVQAANDTNEQSDRDEIQNEINQLTSEINRIANTTEFNGKKLLNGDSTGAGNSSVQSSATIDFNSEAGKTGSTVLNIGGESYTINFSDTEDFNTVAGATTVDANNKTITISTGDAVGGTAPTTDQLASELVTAFQNMRGNDPTLSLTEFNFENDGGNFKISANETGKFAGGSGKESISFSSGSSVVVSNVTEGNDGTGGKINLQIGANTGQGFVLNIEDMSANGLGISGSAGDATANHGASFTGVNNVTNGSTETTTTAALDISTHDKATKATSVLNDAIKTVSSERSKLGASQNRLEHTISNLDNSSENLQAAESRIRDVDMAKEIMEFTKQNILSQASQSMLAQANQAPQQVLQLLG